MWRYIDKLTPAGTTHQDVLQGRNGEVVFVVAGIAGLFLLLLLLDAIYVRIRNQRRFNGPPARERFTFFKRILGWLLYPSFQSYFKSED